MTPSLRIAAITLRVPDLTRSVAFYTGQIGFVSVASAPGNALLGVSTGAPPILSLVEDRSAPPAPRNAAGLFHAALLFPNRAALGSWLKSTVERGAEFDGFSDHGVSEAIYLTDPDGNGLEFYADRPRAAWAFAGNGEVAMTTLALDVPSLLAAASAPSETPLAGAHWGHLHLRVTNLDRSEKFYHDTLGLEVTQRSYPGARFMATDGYHHHLGLNTWGQPRAPQPRGALGFVAATVIRKGIVQAQTVSDPDGMELELLPAS